MRESNLKFFSLGIVVKDKKPGDDFIEVSPIEEFNIQESGLIDEKEKTSKSNLKDSNNKGFNTEVKSKNTVTAKWISLGVSNRTTAPDVYKSETVILFKYADVNEYFWTTIFREPNLRRLETVLYQYSNLKAGLESYKLDTSYWYLVDTRNKTIKLHTSNNDNELVTYDITIKTDKGYIEIIDGKKNLIILDSANDRLIIETNNETIVNTKNKVEVTTPRTIFNSDIFVNGNVYINQNLYVPIIYNNFESPFSFTNTKVKKTKY